MEVGDAPGATSMISAEGPGNVNSTYWLLLTDLSVS
jgi:hypothetical protein